MIGFSRREKIVFRYSLFFHLFGALILFSLVFLPSCEEEPEEIHVFELAMASEQPIVPQVTAIPPLQPPPPIEPTPKPGHNLPNSLVLDQYFITHKGVYVTGFEKGGKLFFSDLQEDSGADYYSGSDYYYSSDYYNYSYTASGYNFITGSGLPGFIQPLDNKKFIEPRIIYVDPSGKAWQANLDDTLYEQVLTPLP